jgi:hypothetical protein
MADPFAKRQNLGTSLLTTTTPEQEARDIADLRRQQRAWRKELGHIKHYCRGVCETHPAIVRPLLEVLLPAAFVSIREKPSFFPCDELKKVRREFARLSFFLERATISGLKSTSGSGKRWGDRRKVWERWQAFIESQHIHHPELTFSGLIRLCANRFDCSFSVVKRRCQNPAKIKSAKSPI